MVDRRTGKTGPGTPAPQEFPRRLTGLFVGPGFITPGAVTLAPPDPEALAETGGELPVIVLIPNTFEEMIFHTLILNPSRESSVVIEQTVGAGASGTVTVAIAVTEIDIARFLVEGGDGSISYSIDVQSAGQTAVADHRITGGVRSFARYWEKTGSIIVRFTNNDAVNPALLQLMWESVRLETVKWTAYRDNLRAWSRIIGVEP